MLLDCVPSQLHFVRQGARGIDGACHHAPILYEFFNALVTTAVSLINTLI